MSKAPDQHSQKQVISLKDRMKRIQQLDGEKIKISDLLEILGSSSFHILIILFVTPSAFPLPAIPGITQILALMVLFLFVQLTFCKKQLWLPNRFKVKELQLSLLKKVGAKIESFHNKFEFMIKKRLTFFFIYPIISLIYIFCIILAFCVALPIPFSNTTPSIAILIICFSIIERDGLLLILGLLVGIVGVAIVLLIYLYGAQYLSDLFS